MSSEIMDYYIKLLASQLRLEVPTYDDEQRGVSSVTETHNNDDVSLIVSVLGPLYNISVNAEDERTVTYLITDDNASASSIWIIDKLDRRNSKFRKLDKSLPLGREDE